MDPKTSVAHCTGATYSCCRLLLGPFRIISGILVFMVRFAARRRALKKKGPPKGGSISAGRDPVTCS